MSFRKLSLLSRYVDVDFVRKSVRAISRCAIKVEQASERCASTLLGLSELIRSGSYCCYQGKLIIFNKTSGKGSILNPITIKCSVTALYSLQDTLSSVLVMIDSRKTFVAPNNGTTFLC